MWGGVFVNSFSALSSLAQGALLLATPSAFAVFVLLGLLVSLHLRPALFSVCVHVLFLLTILLILSTTLLFGGLITGSAAIIWGFLIPIGALAGLGERAGKFWLGAFFITSLLWQCCRIGYRPAMC